MTHALPPDPGLHRRVFLRQTAGATIAASLALPAFGAATREPAPEELLDGAAAQIEKHRKAEGTFVVRDAQGRPAPGARVRIVPWKRPEANRCEVVVKSA